MEIVKDCQILRVAPLNVFCNFYDKTSDFQFNRASMSYHS